MEFVRETDFSFLALEDNPVKTYFNVSVVCASIKKTVEFSSKIIVTYRKETGYLSSKVIVIVIESKEIGYFISKVIVT